MLNSDFIMENDIEEREKKRDTVKLASSQRAEKIFTITSDYYTHIHTHTHTHTNTNTHAQILSLTNTYADV